MRDKRTAKLWLQYLEMVEILLSFIKSDRTGNWQLHLKNGSSDVAFPGCRQATTISQNPCTPYLHNLQETPPEVYIHFGGYHVIMRSGQVLGWIVV